MALVAAAVAAAVVASGALERSRYTALLLALAVGLAAMAAVRATPWLIWIDILAATVLTAIAAVGAESWRTVASGVLRWMAKLLPAPLLVARSTGIKPGPRSARIAPVARGLALGSILVVVFGSLFASADAAFAQISENVLSPEIDLGLIPARLAVLLAVVAFCGATVLIAHAPRSERQGTEAKGAPEWVIALGLLDALFVVFIVVQVRVLFGGNDHVLDTAGLSYAEYAREGFYQLLVVAFLTLAVVALAGRRRGRRSGKRPTPIEFLLGLLCVLTLVVLVSALRRLGLLEDAYGFTVTRLLGHAATLWVGAILLLVAVAGAAQRTELVPRAVVAVSAAGILAFSLLNPEGIVAGKNVDRYERTGKIDKWYLEELGPDATPALARLPRRLALPLVEQTTREAPADDGFFELNLARVRARDALEDIR